MEKTNLIILCVALALIAVLVIVWIVTAGRSRKSFLLRLSEKDEQIRLKDEDIRSRDEAVIRAQAEAHTAQELRKNDAEAHANTLKMLKEANETALRQQIEAIRSQMTAET